MLPTSLIWLGTLVSTVHRLSSAVVDLSVGPWLLKFWYSCTRKAQGKPRDPKLFFLQCLINVV